MEKNVLKWQGGKSNLFEGPIKKYLPQELFDSTQNITAIDAFAGGGSVFMFFLNNCPGVKRVIINDFNTKLIQLYSDIREHTEDLIDKLEIIQSGYNSSSSKASYYLDMRKKYNDLSGCLDTSALLLCLNRTCFNGIYRENSSGEFNVSWGKRDSLSYTPDVIREISCKLNSRPIVFLSGDFSGIKEYITSDTFLYLDPPYRPLSGSNSFTSYVSSSFNDKDQERLKLFCDSSGCKVMVSNSYDPNDNFLLNLYNGYRIIQIDANRSSGGKNAKRGQIKENLILNY